MPAKPKQQTTSLQGKAYKESLSELFSTTALQARDIDQKAIQLMDAFQQVGKADAACEHLKTSLEGIVREKVQNWRAYSYSLLRAFDADVYNSMKEKAGGNRRQQGGKKEKTTPGQNPNAVEFVPGNWWTGDASNGSFAPAVPQMGYPMNMMMMMPQMMVPMSPSGGGAPPPPPTTAAEVPKTEENQAPAPDKPADSTVKTEEAEKPAAESKEAAR